MPTWKGPLEVDLAELSGATAASTPFHFNNLVMSPSTTGYKPQGNVDEIGDKANSCVPP